MFRSELVVMKVPKTKFSYQLVDPLVWDNGNKLITVPQGFVCDFASVPWLFQALFPKMGTLSDAPAVLHDFLYVTEYFDRKTCDEIFLEALFERGTSKWKAYSMYWAVRAGGWFVWNKHDPDEVAAIRDQFGFVADS